MAEAGEVLHCFLRSAFEFHYYGCSHRIKETKKIKLHLHKMILKSLFSLWILIYILLLDCGPWGNGVIYALAVCSISERIRYCVVTFLCVRAYVRHFEGVLMPAANWHTQQMGKRLIPCLLTVHLNVCADGRVSMKPHFIKQFLADVVL